ncbi:MAG: DUF5615 family PIN-like protein [bacterium]
MNFLANENFPLLSIQMLRRAGYNIASILEETPGAKDIDILKRAQKENRVILTFDRDYGELIYQHRQFVFAGVLYFRFEPATPKEPAEILLKILQKKEILINGKFTVVERSRIRQRSLTDI